MTVQELLSKLNKLDPNLNMVCYTETEEMSGRVLDILDVKEETATTSRNDNGIVIIKFDSSVSSNRFACLEVTSDL